MWRATILNFKHWQPSIIALHPNIHVTNSGIWWQKSCLKWINNFSKKLGWELLNAQFSVRHTSLSFCVWLGDAIRFGFNDNRALLSLCRPGNGIADAGKTAIDFRAFSTCSVGFLYNGFVNRAKSLSANCSPQSHTGRKTKWCW